MACSHRSLTPLALVGLALMSDRERWRLARHLVYALLALALALLCATGR